VAQSEDTPEPEDLDDTANVALKKLAVDSETVDQVITDEVMEPEIESEIESVVEGDAALDDPTASNGEADLETEGIVAVVEVETTAEDLAASEVEIEPGTEPEDESGVTDMPDESADFVPEGESPIESEAANDELILEPELEISEDLVNDSLKLDCEIDEDNPDVETCPEDNEEIGVEKIVTTETQIIVEDIELEEEEIEQEEIDTQLPNSNLQPVVSVPDPYFFIDNEKHSFLPSGGTCPVGDTLCTVTETPIQDALIAAGGQIIDDDTIYVEGGYYTEDVLIENFSSLILKGAADHRTSTLSGLVTIRDSQNITLRDFKFTQSISIDNSTDITITGTDKSDSLDVTLTGGTSTVTVEGGEGDDEIDTHVDAGAGGTVDVDGGADDDTIDADAEGEVSGGEGDDKLIVNGTVNNDVISVSPTLVTVGDPVVKSITYSEIETLLVNADTGADIITTSASAVINGGEGVDALIVNGTNGADTINIAPSRATGTFAVEYNAIETLAVNGDAGDDSINVSLAAAVPLTIDGGEGSSDTLIVDVVGSGIAAQTATSIDLSNGSVITFDPANLETLTLSNYDRSLSESDKINLLAGLDSLETWGDSLETHDLLDHRLPVVNVTLGGFMNMSQALAELRSKINSYFAVDDTPTLFELRSALSDWNQMFGDLDVATKDLAASTKLGIYCPSGTCVDDFALDLTLEATRTKNVVPDLGPASLPETEDLNLLFEDSSLEMSTTMLLDFGFGLDLAPASDIFFINNIDSFTVNGDVHVDDFAADLAVGFLGLQVENGDIDLDADLSLALIDPDDSDGYISETELTNTALESLVAVVVTSNALTGTFPMTVPDGFSNFNPSGAELMFASADVFGEALPSLATNTIFRENFTPFAFLRAQTAMDMLRQFGTWLSMASRSEVFDTALPFVNSLKLGSLVDLGEAFEDIVTNHLAATILVAPGAVNEVDSLSEDVEFTIWLDGAKLQVTVAAAVVADNTGIDDLVADIQAAIDIALDAKGFNAGDVTISSQDDQISFTASASSGVGEMRLGAAEDSPFVTNWNFRTSQTAKNNAEPIFSNIQELVAELSTLLGFQVWANYDTSDKTLTFDIQVGNYSFSEKTATLNLDGIDFGALQVSTANGVVSLAAAISFAFTFGIDLTPSVAPGIGVSVELGEDIDGDGVPDAVPPPTPENGILSAAAHFKLYINGVPIYVTLNPDDTNTRIGLPTVLSANADVSDYELSDDAQFNLTIDGTEVTVTLPAAETEGNFIINELVSDLQAVIDSALLVAGYTAGLLVVGNSGDRLSLKLIENSGIDQLLFESTSSVTTNELMFASSASLGRSGDSLVEDLQSALDEALVWVGFDAGDIIADSVANRLTLQAKSGLGVTHLRFEADESDTAVTELGFEPLMKSQAQVNGYFLEPLDTQTPMVQVGLNGSVSNLNISANYGFLGLGFDNGLLEITNSSVQLDLRAPGDTVAGKVTGDQMLENFDSIGEITLVDGSGIAKLEMYDIVISPALPGFNLTGDPELVLLVDDWYGAPNSATVTPNEDFEATVSKFENVSFDTISDALDQTAEIVEVLYDRLGLLNTNIPLIDVPISSIQNYPKLLNEVFELLVADPVISAQELDTAFSTAMGFPVNGEQVVVIYENDVLKLELQHEASVERGYRVNFDWGTLASNSYGAGADYLTGLGAESEAAVTLTTHFYLVMGIRVTDPANPEAFLFTGDSGTRLITELNAIGEELSFNAYVDPLTVTVDGGELLIDGDGDPGTDDSATLATLLDSADDEYSFSTDKLTIEEDAIDLTSFVEDLFAGKLVPVTTLILGQAQMTLPLNYPAGTPMKKSYDCNGSFSLTCDSGDDPGDDDHILGVTIASLTSTMGQLISGEMVDTVSVSSPDVGAVVGAAKSNWLNILTNPDVIIGMFDDFLANVQNILDDFIVNDVEIPLLDGVTLKDSLQVIEDFREDFLLKLYKRFDQVEDIEPIAEFYSDYLLDYTLENDATFTLHLLPSNAEDFSRFTVTLLADETVDNQDIQALGEDLQAAINTALMADGYRADDIVVSDDQDFASRVRLSAGSGITDIRLLASQDDPLVTTFGFQPDQLVGIETVTEINSGFLSEFSLDSDSNFTLQLSDGNETFLIPVLLNASETENNDLYIGLSDTAPAGYLALDIQEAINSALLAHGRQAYEVQVTVALGFAYRLRVRSGAGVDDIALTTAPDDPTVTQLGFNHNEGSEILEHGDLNPVTFLQESIFKIFGPDLLNILDEPEAVEEAGYGPPAQLVSTDVISAADSSTELVVFDPILESDEQFILAVDGKVISVTVSASETSTNTGIDDLVSDFQSALDSTLAGEGFEAGDVIVNGKATPWFGTDLTAYQIGFISKFVDDVPIFKHSVGVPQYTIPEDAHFTLSLGGTELEITVPAAITLDNVTINDLIEDLQAVLDTALTANGFNDGDVEVGKETVQDFGAGNDGGDNLTLTAKANTGITELSLGVQAGIDSQGLSTVVLNENAYFILRLSFFPGMLDEGTQLDVPVNLSKNATTDNQTMADLVDDLQAAIDSALASKGRQAGEFVVSDYLDIFENPHLRLYAEFASSDELAPIIGVELLVDDDDFALGFIDGQEFVANDPAATHLNFVDCSGSECADQTASGGLYLDGEITVEDVVVYSDDFVDFDQPCGPLATFCQFNIHLGKEFFSKDFDLSFDQIGGKVLGIEVDGEIEFYLTFDLEFGFGVSKDVGPYFDVSTEEELKVQAGIRFPGCVPEDENDNSCSGNERFHFTGNLLFLQLDALDGVDLNDNGEIDDDEKSGLNFKFAIDIKDPDAERESLVHKVGEIATGCSGGRLVVDLPFKDITSENCTKRLETIEDIAGLYGRSTTFLLDFNDLPYDTVLTKDQKLNIPLVYSVRPDLNTSWCLNAAHLCTPQTLSEIAAEVGLSVDVLINVNQLENQSLKVGQKLKLSIGSHQVTKAQSDECKKGADQCKTVLKSIASQQGISYEDLLSINELTDKSLLTENQWLVIPETYEGDGRLSYVDFTDLRNRSVGNYVKVSFTGTVKLYLTTELSAAGVEVIPRITANILVDWELLNLSTANETYVVQFGDTLSKIAKDNRVTVSTLQSDNEIALAQINFMVGSNGVLPDIMVLDIPTAKAIERPTIKITDVNVNLGSFLSHYVGSTLRWVKENTLDHIAFLIDPETGWLYQKEPVFSLIYGETKTVLDVIELFFKGTKKIRPFIDAVSYIYGLLKEIPESGDLEIRIVDCVGIYGPDANKDGVFDKTDKDALCGNVKLDMDVDDDEDGVINSQDKCADTPDKAQVDGSGCTFDQNRQKLKESMEKAGADAKEKRFVGQLNKEAGFKGEFKLAFPILTPSQMIALLQGENATLFTLDMPEFAVDVSLTLETTFYIIPPPIIGYFKGTFSFSFDFAFGFDTYGFNRFLDSGKAYHILDGFYVSDRANADGSGADVTEIEFGLGIEAGLGLNLGVAKVTGGGGIEGTVEMDFNDPNDDGRVRFSEMGANITACWEVWGEVQRYLSPMCVFDISGKAELYFKAAVEVTVPEFTKEWEIGRFTIFEWEMDIPRRPVIAEFNDENKGILMLNSGPFSEYRLHGDLDDGDDIYTVLGDDQEVIVQSLNVELKFKSVSKIIAKGGLGDDSFDFSGLLNVNLEVEGGEGDDTILGTELVDIFYGGPGNDLLKGGDGDDILYGESGNDTLEGDNGADTLYGGSGDDDLDGGNGEDQLNGELGNDKLEGGLDSDTFVFDDGWGLDTVTDQGGEDDYFDLTLVDQRVKVRMSSANVSDGTNTITHSGHEINRIATGRGADTFVVTNTDTLHLDGGYGNDKYIFGGGTGTITVDDTGSARNSDVVKIQGKRNTDDTLTIRAESVGVNDRTLVEHNAQTIYIGENDDIELMKVELYNGDDTLYVTGFSNGLPVQVYLGDDDDTLHLGRDAVASETDPHLLNDFGDSLYVNGGEGVDALFAYDNTDASDNDGKLSAKLLSGLGLSDDGLSYYNLEGFTLNLGDGLNNFVVADTAEGTATTINGGHGASQYTVTLTSSTTTIIGGAGDDEFTVWNTEGGTTLSGLGGNDTMTLNKTGGLSTLLGGPGADKIVINSTGGETIIEGNLGSDNIKLLGSGGPTTIDGNGDPDTITFEGAGGDGTVNGGDGADTITILDSFGVTVVNGNGGDDIINVEGTGGETTVNGDEGVDSITISGSGGTTTINGGHSWITSLSWVLVELPSSMAITQKIMSKLGEPVIPT